MWERCINILLAIWLINAVTYFQTSSQLRAAGEIGVTASSSYHQAGTWIGYIGHILDNGAHDTSDKTHQIKYKRRYINTRSVSFSVLLITSFVFLFTSLAKTVNNHSKRSHSTELLLRPAYYNFLFRLSPF